MRIYSIYDVKAEAYSSPFVSMNNATAIRAFTELANTEGHQFNSHPEDYTLFCLADWKEQSGEILPLTATEHLGVAINYIRKAN